MTAEERAALLADLHTTTMGEERIRRNAAPDADDEAGFSNRSAITKSTECKFSDK